jgi:hypothetical protein
MTITAYNMTAGIAGAGFTARLVLILSARGDEPGLPSHLLRS